MSFEKTSKSDRFQIIRAVLFMGIFAALFLIAVVPKGAIPSLVCSYARAYDGFSWMCANVPSDAAPTNPGEFIASRINSACVDAEGLKISVAFDKPLMGEARIQVFSTGPDFFPSARGLTDTYEITTSLPTAMDHLDHVVPVESMPVGEPIFGNIIVNEESFSSHVTYLINVSDCSTTSELVPGPAPTSIPGIHSATCLPTGQLMIALEFEKPVQGQYQALIADRPYMLASVVNQPAVLFFSGEPPPEGPIVIKLVSAIDEVVVFEETYTPPVCSPT
jgi:hypothetical protein